MLNACLLPAAADTVQRQPLSPMYRATALGERQTPLLKEYQPAAAVLVKRCDGGYDRQIPANGLVGRASDDDR